MAIQAKNYLDYNGLSTYDTNIKNVIASESAKAYKTILFNSENDTIYFYKQENATLSDDPDLRVPLYSAGYIPSFSGNALKFDY